jgi:hypothetical protein
MRGWVFVLYFDEVECAVVVCGLNDTEIRL